ncbi:MAG: metallophosphoesterase [Cyclobacteriaceae bacterium]
MTTILIILVIFGLIDLYVFKGVSNLISVYAQNTKLSITIIYWFISLLCIGLLIYGIANRGSFRSSNSLTLIIGVFVSFLLPKLIFLGFHALDDLFNLASYGVSKFSAEGDYSRRNFITQVGMFAGGLMFGGMVYGVLWGKFNFRVLTEDISSPRIPRAFDGLKIVHISDAHLGSFGNSFEPIKKAIKMINDLDPDYVFFTGDLVNNHANEAEPWIEVFREIRSKKGKFSIFGNHDYADYGSFSKQEKETSVQRLKAIHDEMGFHLLQDTHVVLKEDDAAISLIGVHNWGQGFHQIGDLAKAMDGVADDHFKILLSHDPTHFEMQVKNKTNIDLTLSGHTHGMQMGIEVPVLNIKWSPVRFRYPRWAGLYRENGQSIYINRGFGVLAYPGRVGMAPEITLLTLKSEAAASEG